MKITAVRSRVLVWPPHDPMFWMSLLPVTTGHELVVEIETDEGLIGVGHTDQIAGVFARSGDGSYRLGNASRIVPDAISPMLISQDPLANEAHWETMFSLTYRRHWSKEGWSRQQMMAAIAATDMALWDLQGKATGLPVFRLLGGSNNRVPCYMAGGYYRDRKTVDRLAAEMKKYRVQGFTAVKMRVGGVSLGEDIERVQAAREALGPDVKLMLDANEAYDSMTAIKAAEAFAPSDIFWLEEPARWYEGTAALKRVSEVISIPLAGGEQCVARWDAAEYVEGSGISYMEFDGMRTGGPTEWLKVAGYCAAKGIPMSPHHGPHIHAHLVAAVPNGLFAEVFASPFDYDDESELQWARWDKKREMFAIHPDIVEGDMILSDRPGWGIELDPEVIAKRELTE
jgi:L-alanine-DL-glutamate epimerase-like enolase superfamily enzyme